MPRSPFFEANYLGSIRNAPSGRWQARYRDGHGRPRSKTFRTKAEARRFLERNGAKSIQSRMGHSSVSITLDRYGHLLPSLDDQIAEGLERMFRLAAIERTGARPVAVAELQPAP